MPAAAAWLERERAFLRDLPLLPFDPRLVETRRVLSDCTVSYQRASYSVPWLLVGKKVTVKAEPRSGRIEVFDGPALLATHQTAQKGQRIIGEEHIAPLR